jgi:hypothetical protein
MNIDELTIEGLKDKDVKKALRDLAESETDNSSQRKKKIDLAIQFMGLQLIKINKRLDAIEKRL